MAQLASNIRRNGYQKRRRYLSAIAHDHGGGFDGLDRTLNENARCANLRKSSPSPDDEIARASSPSSFGQELGNAFCAGIGRKTDLTDSVPSFLVRPKLSASRHLCPFRLLRVLGLRRVGPRRSASSLPSRTSQQQGFLDSVCGLSLFALTFQAQFDEVLPKLAVVHDPRLQRDGAGSHITP